MVKRIRTIVVSLTAGTILIFGGLMVLNSCTSTHRGSVDLPQLKEMTQADLDRLYERSEAGPIPNGASAGTSIIFPESPMYEAAQASTAVWEGKVFDCPDPAGPCTLLNKVNGRLVLPADVYFGESLHDGKPCIVIDYSNSPAFERLRFYDEIRKVADGLYLGRMYRQNDEGVFEFMLNFICDFKGVD